MGGKKEGWREIEVGNTGRGKGGREVRREERRDTTVSRETDRRA